MEALGLAGAGARQAGLIGKGCLVEPEGVSMGRPAGRRGLGSTATEGLPWVASSWVGWDRAAPVPQAGGRVPPLLPAGEEGAGWRLLGGSLYARVGGRQVQVQVRRLAMQAPAPRSGGATAGVAGLAANGARLAVPLRVRRLRLEGGAGRGGRCRGRGRFGWKTKGFGLAGTAARGLERKSRGVCAIVCCARRSYWVFIAFNRG